MLTKRFQNMLRTTETLRMICEPIAVVRADTIQAMTSNDVTDSLSIMSVSGFSISYSFYCFVCNHFL